MRLIFLTLGYHPDLAGGAYRYVAEVARGLVQKGHQVSVICPNPQNALPPLEARDGVELLRFKDEDGAFWQNWLKENQSARRLLDEVASREDGQTCVINCHAFFEPCMRGWANHLCLFTGPWAEEFRMSAARQNASAPKRLLNRAIITMMRRVERQSLTRAARILTISDYYLRMLGQWHGKGMPPLSVISGGVDHARFAPLHDRDKARSNYGIAPDDFVFLSVRRLEARMGLESLVEAFSQVSRNHPKVRLWIAGSGSLRESLQRQIESLGLSQSCRLLGFVPEAQLPEIFGIADCTVMPSLDLEGFGLATVESLACGTPVVGSNSGATPELLEPLSVSLLFESGSAVALAGIMEGVLTGSVKLPDRHKCREYCVSNFSWSRPVEGLENAALAMIRGGGPG